jgi:D-psicose/D-tagatose/L-ribulose 3-epimerase
MKLGMSAFAWTRRFETGHLALLPKVRDWGFDGFEVAMFEPRDLPVTALRRAFAESGLEATVCAIPPAGVNAISADANERRRAKEHLVRCVAASAEMGAKLMGGPVYAPNGALVSRRRTEDEWRWGVECMQGVGEALEEFGVTLAIEPVNRSESLFLATVGEAVAFCRAIGQARVGITLDTFHANIEEKDVAGAVRAAGPLLRHVHASENDRGLLGTGHVDFAGVVGALREIGYEGFLTIEGFGTSASEPEGLGFLCAGAEVAPEMVAVEGMRYLKGLLGDAKTAMHEG